MRLKYTAEARLDLLEALTYYEEQQEGLAADFHKELIRAESEITANPHFWHPVGDGLRRKHFRRYPYSLIYQIEQDFVLILAAAHSSRKPNYWLDR